MRYLGIPPQALALLMLTTLLMAAAPAVGQTAAEPAADVVPTAAQALDAQAADTQAVDAQPEPAADVVPAPAQGADAQAADTQAVDAQPEPESAPEPVRPLLLPGKESLYQRVLTRPDAVLRSAPEAGLPAEPIAPFTVLYVYARADPGGGAWLQVGVDSHANELAWIPADQVIPWNQALTVAFRDPLGHDRVLLFDDEDALRRLATEYDLPTYRQLYRQAVEGELPPDAPVVAIQPKAYVDIQDDFYLVPIRSFEDVFLGAVQARLLEVASVPLAAEPEPPRERSYRAGLVFVIDATISMGPYIDRTREAMRKIYDSIEQAGLVDNTRFGLIAYRDNLEAVPGLGYLTKTYVTLEEGRTGEGFATGVAAVAPAPVSSRHFVEDAYAGIKQAIEAIDWRPYDARYIVVISDAGPRLGEDPLAATGLDSAAIRQLALDKGIAIWVLHLETPQGEKDHPTAEQAYRAVSRYPGIGDFYYGVDMGSVEEFGRVLEALAAQITQQVRETAQGVPPMPLPEDRVYESQLAAMQQKVSKLGYALRLRYLEKQKGTQVPDVFDAWLVDRDFTDPERQTLDVRVLLTRDQLSDLQGVLRQVLETAEEGVLAPGTFLSDLQSLAATVSRDPAAVAGSTQTTGAQGANLADLGYMREYIEDLPYTGEVMNVTISDWEEWPAQRQIQFINRLEAKINYYQALHDNTDLWVSLDGGPITGDSVFPVVLDMLP